VPVTSGGGSPSRWPGSEVHDSKGYDELTELCEVCEVCEVQPKEAARQQGYDTDAIRDDLEDRGIEAVVPSIRTRTDAIEYEHYKLSNLVERPVFARRDTSREKPQAPSSPNYASLCTGRMGAASLDHNRQIFVKTRRRYVVLLVAFLGVLLDGLPLAHI
jgi:hypothetical protein